MRPAVFLVFALATTSLGGCKDDRCDAPLAPMHLYEGFCEDGKGFCFFDRQVPF